MEVGGAQLNAIQLAGAIRDRGHDVIVLSEAGPLVDRVRAMDLEHIEIPRGRRQPSATVARTIVRLIRRRNIDLVHGHEWPPILDAFLGQAVHRAPVVGTVMSMSVASWLPRSVPLTVGTALIRQAAIAAGHRHVTLLEPPVDTGADSPSVDGEAFRSSRGVGRHEILVAMICRLVPDLKLEGLLTACEAIPQLAAAGHKVRLMIVGDGRARDQIASQAANANSAVGREVIVLTGELADPAPAYAAADIIVGQGGSALRGMAFAKPLIVIGENGFSELLTPASAPMFLRQGWYGLGPGSLGSGAPALRRALESLLNSAEQRRELGLFGRQLTEERFSLNQAARTLEDVYFAASGHVVPLEHRVGDFAQSTMGLIGNKLRRRYQRWLGTASADDCNARELVASVLRGGTAGEQNVAAAPVSPAQLRQNRDRPRLS